MNSRMTILFLLICIGIVMPLEAQRRTTELDSINNFLTTIGVDDITAHDIITLYPAMSYVDVVTNYAGGFGLIETENGKEWNFSTWAHYVPESFIIDLIERDTLIFLEGTLYSLMQNRPNKQRAKQCYQYTMKHFLSAEGSFFYTITCSQEYTENPTVYATNEYLYALMCFYVLYGSSAVFKDLEFVPNDTIWFLESSLSQKEYEQTYGYSNPYKFYYKNIIAGGYCDSSRTLTDEQRYAIESHLDAGIALQSHECILTKAFAQITGLVLEKDIESGKRLLLSIWPEMNESNFWTYLVNI